MSQDLNSLKTSITADGKVDAQEVQQLRDVLLADGKIDRAEADVLFEINDAVAGAQNAPEWAEFLAEAVVQHILEDGEVSDEEAQWLVAKINRDGSVDEAEKGILRLLDDEADEVPDALRQLIDQHI